MNQWNWPYGIREDGTKYDNVPDLNRKGLVFFVPLDTSYLMIGWYSHSTQIYIPRFAKEGDRVYKNSEIGMWKYALDLSPESTENK